jgi:hypothetical protein
MVASPSRSTVEWVCVGPSTVAVGDGRSKDFENSLVPLQPPQTKPVGFLTGPWSGARIAGWEPEVLSLGVPPHPACPIRAPTFGTG